MKVVVVEDSLTVRSWLTEVIEAAGHQVVASATNADDATRLVAQHRPDVVTMDMMLDQGSTGLQATRDIMAATPTPILVVSASTNRGELLNTYDALAAGAVDVVDKPRANDEGWEERFLRRLRLVSRVRVITHVAGRRRQRQEARSPATDRQLLALGASTGGPGAVLELLRGLTQDWPALLVLHLGLGFDKHVVDWLDDRVPQRVTAATDGARLPAPGQLVVAPADRHLVVQGNQLRLLDSPPLHSCRPAVDMLFDSLVPHGPRVVACLLTGMGRDGAMGLLRIRQAGGWTIAQDKATSVVWGMPGEAVRLGAARQVLPLGQIAPTLNRARWRSP